MGIKYKNNAITIITADINNEVTTIPVSNAAVFPELGIDDYCYLTIGEGNINIEIVKVTAIVGNDLTVVRAQQNTTAKSFSSGAPIELRLTAGMLQAGFDEANAYTDKILTTAGVQIGYARASSTTAVSATSTDYTAAEVLTVAYTPKKVGNLLIVRASAPYIQASSDYGAAETNGSIGAQSRIVYGSNNTFGANSQVLSSGRTRDDGEMIVSAPLFMEGFLTVASLAELTFKIQLKSVIAGHTATIYATASFGSIKLEVMEIAQ